MILGAHMSIAGGIHRALERGASIGCRTVQIFTRNQLRWGSPPLDPEDAARFHRLAVIFRGVGKGDGVDGSRSRLLAHASYLINLASTDSDIWKRSVAALTEELRRCACLKIPELVLHPGAHGGAGMEVGAGRLRDGLEEAYTNAGGPAVELLLETTAGAATVLGGSFEEMRDLIGTVSESGVPCGICVDTCHVFAAGYDLRTPETYCRTWERFDTLIGRERLRAVHLNDSRGLLASRSDRHEHIGRGQIGLSGFALLVNDPDLAGVPGILETPKGPDMREDLDNLARLYSLIRSDVQENQSATERGPA
jgi:deoxyribonuclease-4